MNNRSTSITRLICHFLGLVSALLLAIAFLRPHVSNDTNDAARQISLILEHRIAKMDKFVSNALDSDPYGWIDSKGLPDDMVIYRYRNDTLQSWAHLFPTGNDVLTSQTLFQRICNPRLNIQSPLSTLTEEISLCDIGGRWYLAKITRRDNIAVVSGLEITNSLDTDALNGVNPKLHLSDRLSLQPISYSEGSAVYVKGKPLFKIIYDSHTDESDFSSSFVWLAFALVLAAALVYVIRCRSLRSCLIASMITSLSSLSIYFWGVIPNNDFNIFSPTLYAGGRMLYSLGAVVLINLVLFLLNFYTYLCRRAVFRSLKGKKSIVLHSVLLFCEGIAIVFYIHFALKSIIINSNIGLEIYKFRTLSIYSFLVYASFLTLLSVLPMMIQMLRPVIYWIFRVRVNAYSTRSRTIFSVLCSIYLVSMTSVLGFRKEEDRTGLWANQLAVDRDILLEINLKQVEAQIAADVLIPALAEFNGGEQSISGRVTDLYFSRITPDYDISVILDNGSEPNSGKGLYINDRIKEGEAIYEGSRFFYSENSNGRYRYDGVFIYFTQDRRLIKVLVEVEPKLEKIKGGYLNLVASSLPGKVTMPSEYSYARYTGNEIKTFSGNFAYPIVMKDDFLNKVNNNPNGHFIQDGFIHFVTNVDNYETVLVSREQYSPLEYLTSGVMISLMMFFALALFNFGRRKPRFFEKNYYKKRLSIVLMASLSITLVGISCVSIIFVFKRNESNLNTILSDRINSIQALVQNSARGIQSTDDLRSEDMNLLLSNISANTNSDITLFTPSGRVFLSTRPQVFDAMILSTRMDGSAYNNIVNLHKRYYFHKEKFGNRTYFNMYAPILDDNGNLAAIISTPYTTENYDFEQDAILHMLSILAVFILLLSIARFLSDFVLEMMFKPLSEMSRKMDSANLYSLEHIDYSRDDEVASLVKAYNSMVDEMSESSRKLAQAERDKAWSGMARQVAHEIKNPLTPMKLQLQRLIRLKERNAPGWEDRFDEVAKILLDHIEILTGTANEFSTFAKLYSEEHTDINLDNLLQEEISMFDGKDDISFEYMGLEGARISGPKPQLVRVFVNLLGNAVQAVEEVPEDADFKGKIQVSLRKSSTDGYYDIVVEDNGPGVAPENIERLFTPNFTTKNGGSGLGLAISRSILENCGATISYRRSFALGGASFTVHYPAAQNQAV